MSVESYYTRSNMLNLENLDLEKFRNSDLPKVAHFLHLVPIIGQIALAIFKIKNMFLFWRAERAMSRYNTETGSVGDKIEAVQSAIKVAGSLAWKYQLELARIYLLQDDLDLARQALIRVKEARGVPGDSGWYNVRNKNIRSFLRPMRPHIYNDEGYVMKVQHHTAEEALLSAAFFSATKQYEEAYDAYNDVIYHNPLLAPSRRLQEALLPEMERSTSLSKRATQILRDEGITIE